MDMSESGVQNGTKSVAKSSHPSANKKVPQDSNVEALISQMTKNESKFEKSVEKSSSSTSTTTSSSSANKSSETSFWGTVFHLYIVSSGPPLLSVPKPFMKLGLVYATGVIVAVFLFYWYLLHMIIRIDKKMCKLKRRPNMTYLDTLYEGLNEGPAIFKAMAPFSRRFMQLMYVTTWTGSLNVLLISENAQICFKNFLDQEISFGQASLIAFVPLLLLVCVHRLKYLVPFSTAGNAIVISCIGIVVFYCLRDMSAFERPVLFGDLSNLPACLGAVLYTINATALMIPLKNDMRHPSRMSSAFGVLTVSYWPMSVLFSLFNVLCCLRFGAGLKDSVVQNLPDDEYLAQLIVLLFTIALVFQTPVISYVVFDTIWNTMLVEKRKTMKNPLLWEYVVRIGELVVSFTIVNCVPNINVFMAAGGSIIMSFDSMILPAIVETILIAKKSESTLSVWMYALKNAIVVLIAAVMLVTGLHSCIKEIIDVYGGR